MAVRNKLSIVLLVMMAAAFGLFDAGTVSAETLVEAVQTSQTWAKEGSPYLVRSFFEIPEGVTLTIEPGVIVKFESRSWMDVRGTLDAKGGPDEKITLTSLKDDSAGGDSNADGSSTSPTPGNWYGLKSRPGSVIKIDHAVIRYGGSLSDSTAGAIVNHGGDIIVSNSALSENEYSFNVTAGTTTITNTDITRSIYGVFQVGGDLKIEASRIDRTKAAGVYGGFYEKSGSIAISDSMFRDNEYTGVQLEGSGHLVLTRNRFENTALTPIYIALGHGATFENSGNSAVGGKRNGIQLVGTTAGKNYTLSRDGVPYIPDLTVDAGDALNLEPGTIFKFEGGRAGLRIKGDLNADASSSSPIYFTSFKDDSVGDDTNGDGEATFPKGGDWGNIEVGEGGMLSLANTTVRYGGNSLYVLRNNGGAVTIASSSISHNTEFDCGLHNVAGTMVIEGSDISRQGIGICGDGGRVTVTRSRIHDNTRLAVFNAANTESAVIDARDNWWGDASGPKHSEKNPAGLGDQIVGDVEFEPWLTNDPWIPEDKPCCSSILFLPGLQASRLYTEGLFSFTENRLWEPNSTSDIRDLFLDPAGGSIKDNIYTKDVVDEVYGLMALENIYKSFLSDLEHWKTEEGVISDFAAIPYDWRLTMDEILSYGNKTGSKIYYSGTNRATSTPFIIQELSRLSESSKTGKVTIVAHSNGGLLAKALVRKLEEESNPLVGKIDNIVLVGVPQTGTPQAVGALLHGYDQAIPVGLFPVVMTPATAREFGENMPGAYPLLPSNAYWSGQGGSVSTPIARFQRSGFEPIESAIQRYGESIDSKAEMDEFLVGAEFRIKPEKGDVAAPSIANKTLLDYGNALHSELDSWMPPARINVHQIAGWGEETLSTIEYRPKTAGCEVEQSGFCTKYKLGWTYKPILTIDGDGTVVTPSALVMSTSSPNVKRWWVNLNGYNKENINRKHKNILEVEDLRKHIKGVITNNILQTVYISNNQPVASVESRLAFALHSPLELTVIDDLGNLLSSTTSSIPGGNYVRYGEVQYVSVPKDANPTLWLYGYESGYFDLDIEEKNGENVVASTTFSGIPSATTTRATISFNDSSIENATNLEVDSDGNGIADISLVPKVGEVVTVAPPVADDVAPEAHIGFSVDKKEIVITGFDDTSESVNVALSEQTAIIQDNVGNSLTLGFSLKQKENQISFEPSKLEYATTTIMSIPVNASARYHWVTHPKKNSLVLFVAHVQTADENMIVIYSGLTNKSRIITIPKITSDIDLETVEKNMPKGAIIKKVVNELHVPYLETAKGAVNIKN